MYDPFGAGRFAGGVRTLAPLCPPEQAHRLIRGLTLAHLDATLRGYRAAGRVLERAAAG